MEQQMQQQQQQVQWGDPMPAASLLIASLCVGAWSLFAGQVPASNVPLFMSTVVGFGIALVIIAIICFRRGDVLGGTLNMAFGIIFALATGFSGIIQFVLPYFLGSVAKPPMTLPIIQIAPNISGWFILPGAVGLFFMTIIVARMTWFLVGWVVLVSIAFGLSAIWMIIGAPGITDPSQPIHNDLINISGWLFLICGISMLYFGIAGVVNTCAQKMVLPIGSPLIKHR